ncbi:hypothetical protein BJX99DRAFT_258926 [Aspergillus californicus]
MASTDLRDDSFTGEDVNAGPRSKLPDISRKITACVACRKQKALADDPDTGTRSNATCPKGKRHAWKSTMMAKMQKFETAMARVGERLSMPELQSLDQSSDAVQASLDSTRDLEVEGPQPDSQPHETWEVVMDPDCGPASIPASCVADTHKQTSSGEARSTSPADFITRGVISVHQAELLFNIYHQRLDHFLYRVLGNHDSLASVRQSSQLLTAAICSVAALHSDEAGHLFGRCYTEFKNTVTAQLFSRANNLDDVRGVCIGAFWLSQLSWMLVGTAVRIATEIQLHRAIYDALQGDKAAYYQTRVYYLVYVCDHHFSVTYGRPPMTRECASIAAASRFLETENATEDDARLVSQLLIWTVNTHVFDSFSVDVNTPLTAPQLTQLRRHAIALDIWYADWGDSFCPHENIGNYPRKGVGLHFNFAKLYLCSHAFRGAPSNGGVGSGIAPELEDIANTAVLSASAILRVIVSDAELQAYLNGLPLYFDTMIAFAVVFLLKVSTKYSEIVRIDAAKMLDLVEHTVTVMRRITAPMHEQHLLVCIAGGIEKLLKKSQEAAQTDLDPSIQFEDPMVNSFPWIDHMGDFDILSCQNNMSGLGPWSFDFESEAQGPSYTA